MAYDGWERDFRLAEQDFFGIEDDDWPDAFEKKLSKLDVDYDENHEAHCDHLNDDPQLRIDPALEPDEFDGSITLRRLKFDVVFPRVPDDPPDVADDEDDAFEDEV